MTKRVGKLNANRPIGEGENCRTHGTKWKTGIKGVLSPDIIRKFASQGMTLTEIGYLCGCTKQNIHAALKDEELNQAWCEGLAVFIEESTGCLLRNIRNDNTLSAMFALKCRHLPNERGWIEQQYREKTVDEESRPCVQVILPYNHRDPIDENAFSSNMAGETE